MNLDNLPLPATEQDRSFMTSLLEAVRKKRVQATARPITVKKEKPDER